MNTANLLAAAEHLVGFLIVIIALAVLWGLTALMGRVLGGVRPEKAAAPATKPAKEAQADLDDDLIVVAAVAATMLGGRHRVVSVRPIPTTWGQQGRRDIHASHRIR